MEDEKEQIVRCKFDFKMKSLEEEEEEEPRMGDLIREAMPCKLDRAPSLPPPRTRRIRKEVCASATEVSKLTRRSSMDPSLVLLHKNISNSKGCSSNRRRYLERSMSLKSLSDKEVQGFQDLGFTFDKEDLSSTTVADNLTTLQIKEEPSFSQLVGHSSQDLKAQIKFWARSVASNMHSDS